MQTRKEAIRARLAKKLQAKQKLAEVDKHYHSDVPVNAIDVDIPESGSRKVRLKIDRPDGMTVISSEVTGNEQGKMVELLDGIDVCRKAYNQAEGSTSRLILECAYRIMEGHILSDQLAADDVLLDPEYPLEDYLSIARSLSIHRHKLCTFAGKLVKGDIPEVNEGDGVDKVQDLILHELRICTVIHEMIDNEGPTPTMRHALEWCARLNVILRRMNVALKVIRPLRLEVLQDDSRAHVADEPFGRVPMLTSVVYEDALTVEAFLEDWARNARFPKTESVFDADEARKHMRERWQQFVDEEG